MGMFFNDRDGERQSLAQSATAAVAKQTSKFTEVATAALGRKSGGGLLHTLLRRIHRKAEVADVEAGVQISTAVAAIQDNVLHMQTGYARGVNEIERLQNENAQLHVERQKIARTAAAIDRQNVADAATFPTLLKAEQLGAEAQQLAAEAKRLGELRLAVAAAAQLGIDPSYLYDEHFGVETGTAIPVIQVEREKADKLREKAQAEARVIDEKLTSDSERVRKEKRLRAERMTPVGASDEELTDRALLIVDEAISGIVLPESPDRYHHPFAATHYINELIIGTSFPAARKATFDAVVRALKQDITGQRKATRDLALADLKSYYEKKGEYEQITQAAGIGDVLEQVAGGRGDGEDPLR